MATRESYEPVMNRRLIQFYTVVYKLSLTRTTHKPLGVFLSMEKQMDCFVFFFILNLLLFKKGVVVV